MAKTVGVYLRENIETELALRGDNRSLTINRDLERLYALYHKSIREIQLTEKEACLIVDALNGIVLDVNTVLFLWAKIEDSIKLDGLVEKWGVDGFVLVEKLQGLNTLQCMALVDATEKFWKAKLSYKDGIRKCFNITD